VREILEKFEGTFSVSQKVLDDKAKLRENFGKLFEFEEVLIEQLKW
jgi:hypothetical protein